MSELVSIITPCYNSEKFISETIKSVQNQTYSNWEMIIVDDFSQDKTVEIIQNFMDVDSRIHLIQLHKNSGTGIARNIAVENVKGRYIAFLDSDDLWKSSKLLKQIQFMKINNISFTFSFYQLINENGELINKVIKSPLKLFYQQLVFCNFIGNSTGIYDVNFFGKISISSIRKRQDWIVWLTILKIIKVAEPIPEILAFYRIRKDSISSSKRNLLKFNFNIYKQFHQFDTLKSLFFMCIFLFFHFLVKPWYIKRN